MDVSHRRRAASDIADETAVPPGKSARQGRHARLTRPAARRLAEVLAWIAGAICVFTLFLVIDRSWALSSDSGNNALQAWDMLHGHLLLHGWILGDVTFYTFELPLIAVAEACFGLGPLAVHVALSLIYLAVTGCAVALAVTGGSGVARAIRAGVVVAVLAAPILVPSDRWVPLGLPDHTGTTVFVLLSFLLIDRLPGWRWTSPLVCLILAAGQISDMTVRYVAVPAIVVVCGYRALAARRLRCGDVACLVAATVSVPLSLAVRKVMRHFGSYLMVSPKDKLAPLHEWPQNAALTWHALRMLFGQVAGPGAVPESTMAAVFGACCMLAAAAGIVRVLSRWRTASAAEQLMVAVIVINIGSYLVSTLPAPSSQHDLVTVLPCSAALAARLLVPARTSNRIAVAVSCAAAAVAALVPLSVVAAHSTPTNGGYAKVIAWLREDGLSYGLAGYWQSSVISLESGGQVLVRTVQVSGDEARPYAWETNLLWFDPAQHYANFVITDPINGDLHVQTAEEVFGRPASTHRVGGLTVLVYDRNLLSQVRPARLPAVS